MITHRHIQALAQIVGRLTQPNRPDGTIVNAPLSIADSLVCNEVLAFLSDVFPAPKTPPTPPGQAPRDLAPENKV